MGLEQWREEEEVDGMERQRERNTRERYRVGFLIGGLI